MMTDTAIQQLTDTNGQTLVTQAERQVLIQKLSAKWAIDLSTKVESLAYEKSRGVKLIYVQMVQGYCKQVQNAQQNRLNQQQQQQTLQSMNNNNGQFVNQQINMPQHQPPVSTINHSQHQLNHLVNHQVRFPSVPQTLQPRMTNPQATIPNQGIQLRDLQKFNQQTYSSPSLDVSQNYVSQLQLNNPSQLQLNNSSQLQSNNSTHVQLNNPNLTDYLSQPLALQTRYSNSTPSSAINSRARSTTNLNNLSQSSPSTNNSNNVSHQFVVGNSSTNSTTTNIFSSGDRLLQQILLSNNDGTSNKTPLQTRQSTPTMMSQPTRSSTTTNSNPNLNVNPLRTSPSPSVIIMPTSNVQIQPSPNVTIQQSPLNNNNNNGSFSQASSSSQPSSLTMNNNYSSPINRPSTSSGSGSISSPDEETIHLIKYFKENISRLQLYCQKFTKEGNFDKTRHAQTIHEQMIQFINNPTYESLPNAKYIRDLLERSLNRPQQTNSSTTTTNVTVPNPTVPQINEFHQFEKVLTDYISRDQNKSLLLNKFFVEPLTDVINGVPHKKIRLDIDNHSNRFREEKLSLSLSFQLNNELNLLQANRFYIERLPVSHTRKNFQLDEEYFNKNGIILRCKILELSNPLISSLKLKISARYPDDQPEILSLTKTMPPKLEFTDGHPFFEQLSRIFVSHLFTLPAQHTITDILNIWYQSVQSAL